MLLLRWLREWLLLSMGEGGFLRRGVPIASCLLPCLVFVKDKKVGVDEYREMSSILRREQKTKKK